MSAVEAVPRKMGAVNEHAFAHMTQSQVVRARILLSVADVDVAFGQK